MNDGLIASIQRFTLEARHQLEREAAEQLEGMYGWMPDGAFAAAGHYRALKELEDARETRRLLECYADAEKEAGFDARTTRRKLIRETAFTWLNRLLALRMMEERRLLKTTVSRLWDSTAYLYWLADETDLEARRLHDQGDMPINSMGEGPRQESYRHFLLWQFGELSRDVSVLFDPETLASRLCPRPLVLKTLVTAMNAESLAEVWKPGNEETVGWVYQAFAAEEKSAVFEGFSKGKKVAADQIPAATQIFTPHWVVRFLVENSLGRLWLEMHPDSRLREALRYLVPTATGRRRTLKQVRDITFLDPACGSMHFGLVAFDLFVEMYQEEINNAGETGWPSDPSVPSIEEIPAAIIEHNLHGMDIDLRAVQLSALTLFLKARGLNPNCRFTDHNLAWTNVEQLTGGRLEEFIKQATFSHPIYGRVLQALAIRLKDSDNLGSLLRPEIDLERLIAEERRRADAPQLQLLPGLMGDQFQTAEGVEEFFIILHDQLLRHLDAFVRQAPNSIRGPSHFRVEAAKGLRFLRLVSEKYDVVATNPPFLDSRDFNETLRAFLEREFPKAKRNLFSAFVTRNLELAKDNGLVAMITGQSFMFISTYEAFRSEILASATIETLAQHDYHLFAERVDTAAFVLRKESESRRRSNSEGIYFRLVRERNADAKRMAFESALGALCGGQPHPLVFHCCQREFDAIPGKPWVYWITSGIRRLFKEFPNLAEIAEPRAGMHGGDRFRYARLWWEVGTSLISRGCTDRESAFSTGKRWFPYMKGGTYRKWYGNQEWVIAFDKRHFQILSEVGNKLPSRQFYFREGITYSAVASGSFSARISPGGFIFDAGGSSLFPNEPYFVLGLLNTKVVDHMLKVVNPTVNFQVGDIKRIPYPTGNPERLVALARKAVSLQQIRVCWEELTYDFISPPQRPADYIAQTAELSEIEAEIEAEVSHLYGLTPDDSAAIGRELSGTSLLADNGGDEVNSEDEEEEAPGDIPPETWAQKWISYAIGVVLGRFEVGVPGGLGCGEFKHDVIPALRGLAAPDGIIANDSGDPLNLASRIWEALQIMLGSDEAKKRINLALGTGEAYELLRVWLERFSGGPSTSFWKYHFQLFRKRPVYWPLQSPNRRFTVWIFHERLTSDTLFHVRNQIVEPRLRLAERMIADLRDWAETDSQARKESERQRDLADDLREFSRRLKAITDRGYTPHIDDGVLLNAAPLHTVLPSRPETEKAWRELEAGEYDWAQQAMTYWPERVKEKCRTNRSFAIAHGLEELCPLPGEAASGRADGRRRRLSNRQLGQPGV